MTVTLHPVPLERMPAWIQRSADEYARDLVSLGQSPADAQRVAEAGMAQSFPDGRPRPGHAVLDVLDPAGEPVGYLWIGPETDGPAGGDAWWVDDYATAHGARTLGLSVFGFNVAARRLYESLGFDTTKVTMTKRLAQG